MRDDSADLVILTVVETVGEEAPSILQVISKGFISCFWSSFSLQKCQPEAPLSFFLRRLDKGYGQGVTNFEFI